MSDGSRGRKQRHRSTSFQISSELSEGFVKLIFLALGAGILLPWNAFISAIQFFESRFCQANGTTLVPNVEQWFSVLYNLSSVTSLGGIIAAHWVKDSHRDSPQKQNRSLEEEHVIIENDFMTGSVHGLFESMREESDVSSSQLPPKRAGTATAITSPRLSVSPSTTTTAPDYTWWLVLFPLFLYLAVFLLMTLLVLWVGLVEQLFLLITFTGLIICGVSQSVASAGVVGTAGLFDPSIGVGPYFHGQAYAGVLVAIANYLAVLVGRASEEQFYETYCEQDDDENADVSVTIAAAPPSCAPYRTIDWPTFWYFLLGTVVLGLCISGYSYIEAYQKERKTKRAFYNEIMEESGEDFDSYVDQMELSEFTNNDTDWFRGNTNETLRVFGAVKGPTLAIFNTYFITLALFPGFTSDLASVHQCHSSSSRSMNDLYTPWTFVVFNVGDLVGRYLAALVDDTWEVTSRGLVECSFWRFLYLPLFALCRTHHALVWDPLPSDWFSFVVQLSFAVTNGLLTSVAFLHAPSLIPATSNAQTKSSEILNFALSLGLLLGSAFAFPYIRIVRR